VAAAVAVNRGVAPRSVDVEEVRAILRQQGADLSEQPALPQAAAL
jgi:hypothetical protein